MMGAISYTAKPKRVKKELPEGYKRKNPCKYNRTADESNVLTRKSVEWRVVKKHIEGTPLSELEKDEDFKQYVEEIYEYLEYGNDNPNESDIHLRKQICIKRARDNIVRKSKHGFFQVSTHIPAKKFADIDQKRS